MYLIRNLAGESDRRSCSRCGPSASLVSTFGCTSRHLRWETSGRRSLPLPCSLEQQATVLYISLRSRFNYCMYCIDRPGLTSPYFPLVCSVTTIHSPRSARKLDDHSAADPLVTFRSSDSCSFEWSVFVVSHSQSYTQHRPLFYPLLGSPCVSALQSAPPGFYYLSH